MSYETEKARLGKEPFVQVELNLDACSREYGQSYTNLLTYSEQFDHADWAKTNAPTIIANSTIATDGELTADTVEDDSITLFEAISQSIPSFDVTKDYCTSIYIKKDAIGRATRFPILRITFTGSTTENYDLKLDTSTGEFQDLGETYTVETVGDYWRISITAKSVDAANTSGNVWFYPSVGASISWVYSVTAIGSCVIWGAQLVEGSEAGHYVKTTTASAAGACTAALSAGNECRNVRLGCQDTDNFTKIIKPRNFCTSHPNLPVGTELIPCIKGEPKFTPTEIKPDGGISLRSSISITVTDFPHHDRGVDPYFATRSYTANEQGTYFGKLLANNPYYVGRLMRVKDGYIGANGYSESDLQTRLYVIDKITGPVYSGDNITYTIIGSDLLSLAKNTKIQIPAPNDGALNADINSSVTSLVLDAGTTLTDYPTGGGLVAIGDEWMTYTTRSTSTLSGLTRATNGTTADDHKTGDGVQLVRNFTGTPVAVINEILTVDVGISSSYIPYNTSPLGSWNDEETNWHSGVSIDAYIGAPTGALTLLSEICEVFQIDLWWDEIGQEVKLKTNAPPLGNEPVTELTDEVNFIEGKTSITENPDRRISRMVLHYDKLNLADDNRVSNFARHHFETDTEVEGVDLYDEIRLKQITSRWLTDTNDATAIQTAQRYIARFGETPKVAKFTLSAKDASLKTGDLCDIVSSKLQDTDGSKKTTRFQITKYKETKQGHEFSYDALISSFTYNARYAFVADNALDATSPMTVYDNASDAQKLANAFIGPNSGVFPDGGTLYIII